MFTQDSLFIFNELLSMRILPSFRNTYKGAYGIIVFSIFTTEDLKGDWTRDLLILSSTRLTNRPRIHK